MDNLVFIVAWGGAQIEYQLAALDSALKFILASYKRARSAVNAVLNVVLDNSLVGEGGGETPADDLVGAWDVDNLVIGKGVRVGLAQIISSTSRKRGRRGKDGSRQDKGGEGGERVHVDWCGNLDIRLVEDWRSGSGWVAV